MTDDVLRHTPECAGPDLKPFQGARGDDMEMCRNCGRVRVVRALPEPPAPVVTTRWRCREHGAPVNWRGRGCQRCNVPPPTKAQRRARRIAQRMENWQ